MLFNCLGPTDLVNMNNSRYLFTHDSQQAHCYVFYPDLDYQVRQIKRPLKFVSNPLIKYLISNNPNSSLLNESTLKKKFKWGFMSLDQNNRALVFMASDPLAQQVPLIGLWVYGVQIDPP